MARWRVLATIALVAAGLAGCADDDDAAVVTTVDTVPAASARPGAATTVVPPTTTAAAPTTSSTTAGTTAPPTSPPGLAGLAPDAIEVREIGRSVQGRPITAVERGTSGGTRVVVIGVIHGDEDDGVAILERLATAPVPDGIDLWLVESMNPDGQAMQQRGNANGVDLNRNFPYNWGPIAEPGDGEYAGTGPASEPETQAVVDLLGELHPGLVLWYHQDLFRLSPGEGLEGQVKQRYADLTGLPIERITGGTYTGVAATWARNATEAISFIVELGGSLTPEEADRHAAAVLDVATLVAVE
jgi:protein MpaA